jgi:hypothetical protein
MHLFKFSLVPNALTEYEYMDHFAQNLHLIKGNRNLFDFDTILQKSKITAESTKLQIPTELHACCGQM